MNRCECAKAINNKFNGSYISVYHTEGIFDVDLEIPGRADVNVVRSKSRLMKEENFWNIVLDTIREL